MRYVARRLGLLLIFACVLFGSAGRLDWRRGWDYLLAVFLLEVVTLGSLAEYTKRTRFRLVPWVWQIRD